MWRLRVPFNSEDSPRNYLRKILAYDRLLDVENSLSQIDDFVEATLACWEKHVPYGVYNVTNPGAVTTRQVTEWMREEGVTDKELTFFESEDEFMHQAARAPRSSCVLDASKLIAAGIELRPVEEAVRASLGRMRATNQAKVISA